MHQLLTAHLGCNNQSKAGKEIWIGVKKVLWRLFHKAAGHRLVELLQQAGDALGSGRAQAGCVQQEIVSQIRLLYLGTEREIAPRVRGAERERRLQEARGSKPCTGCGIKHNFD